ncbi:MAG TPA: glycoside hydrolase family 38 C-terminal domain-containing protein [Acidimicrobiia bacterium]|jgi:alpha-mannosidase
MSTHEQPQGNGRQRVAIVPHTHWDREWYAPFQQYRLQLVHVLDALLDLLEADPEARFLLDGQTALVDDYLEIRPGHAARLAACVQARQLDVGPFMILMDEFMVSGETIVRDLQAGQARARELGGAMPVAYLPDMFGHVAQMPQILRLAGLEHAVVWRGVPSAVDRTAFWWEAPDGSRVRAEYLYGSYSNGRELPNDPAQLVARARNYRLELGDAALPGGDVLLMNGSDHLPAQTGLTATIAAANAFQGDDTFAIASLADYVRAQPTDGLRAWCGELRSGARANVLMGVASNRVDVHQLAAAAERALERRAEPLAALFLPPDRYPDRLLWAGWRNLILNSAHDSSCACSADEVVEAVRVRYQEARQVGDALARDALETFAAGIDAAAGSIVVVNPTAVARDGVVEIVVPGVGPLHLVAVDDGGACPTQLLRTRRGEGLSATVTGQKIRWVLELMRGPELAGARIGHVDRNDRDDGVIEYTFHDAAAGEPDLDLEATREELLALGDAGATIAIRQRRAAARDVLFTAAEVPGFGWRTYRVVEGDGPGTAVSVAGTAMANEHVQVEIDAGDGTVTIEADGVRVAGANRLVDSGDGGDTYNYSPPTQDLVVDTPASVAVTVEETGPVRVRVAVDARYELPQHAVGDERSCARRSDETVVQDVRTVYELRTGERFLRVRVELDNRARDHRLRAHVPLPAAVTGSDAECAFAVVHRGLTAEGGPHEAGLPTFVSRRFVDCSDGDAGVALLHDGLLEYEVAAGGTALALTLLRATGYLSRSELSLRPNPAGPLDPLDGPQLQRPLAVDYAVLPHRGDWRAAHLAEAADAFLLPLERARVTAVAPATAARGSALAVDGARVTAVQRDGGGALVVRAVNDSPESTTLRVPLRGDVVDLTGRVVTPFPGELVLRPWEMVTLRVATASPSRPGGHPGR